MKIDTQNNMQDIDDVVQATKIARGIADDILLQNSEPSAELTDFMSTHKKDMLLQRMAQAKGSKSELLESVLTQDMKAKELQFRTLLEQNSKKRIRLKRLIAVASTAAAAIFFITFSVVNNGRKSSSNSIVSVLAQKSYVTIPTIVTSRQQVIGIGDEATNTEDEVGYVSINEKVVSYDISKNVDSESLETNKLIVPALFTQKLILEDGTEVIVNSCSELEYPVKFSGKSREVTLRGEAYFKVAKSSKPFYVKMNGSSIKVLGTEFNVNARESDLITAVLVNGSVAVGFGRDTVMMRPNDMAVIDKKKSNIEVSVTDVRRHVAWLEGYSEFINADFGSVIKELSGWYGVDFMYDVTEFRDTKLNISIEKSLSLLETFSKLKMAINLSINLNKEGKYEIKRVKN